MNLSTILLAGASFMFVACSSSTEPGPNTNPITVASNDSLSVQSSLDGPVAMRTYDAARGGIQITAIYFNQGLNDSLRHINDEWVVLESDGVRSIDGWRLNAGDNDQNYTFTGSINRKILLYTHTGEGATGDTTRAWGRSAGTWIWNNSEPDTARLYNADGILVATATYRAK